MCLSDSKTLHIFSSCLDRFNPKRQRLTESVYGQKTSWHTHAAMANGPKPVPPPSVMWPASPFIVIYLLLKNLSLMKTFFKGWNRGFIKQTFFCYYMLAYQKSLSSQLAHPQAYQNIIWVCVCAHSVRVHTFRWPRCISALPHMERKQGTAAMSIIM